MVERMKRKFHFFGHCVRGGGTARAVIEGGIEERSRRGRPQGNWIGNLRELNGKEEVEVSRMVKDRGG